MIKLRKGQIPARLQQNAQKWTAELLSAIAAGQKAEELRKSKYNHQDVKDAIKRETNGKCAYCESDPLHVSYADIEHIIPKSINPALTYDWNNLTLGCTICNTRKSNKEGFVDPYTDDPSDHLQFVGPMLRAKTEIGKHTWVGLDLNRLKLIERRHEKLQDLERRWTEIAAATDPNLKKTLQDALEQYAKDPATEFSACISTYQSLLTA
jgi:hypothetical protein